MTSEDTAPVQAVENRAISPPCFAGQHAKCPGRKSYFGEDGVPRTLICNCACHEQAPVAGPKPPDSVYRISWEYEEKQTGADGKEISGWVGRTCLTTSREIAKDWLDAIVALMETNQVRHLRVKRSAVVWEELGQPEPLKPVGPPKQG